MGVRLTPDERAGAHVDERVRRPARATQDWKRLARRTVTRLAQHPPQLHAWLCIHRYEGSWTDTGDPYWGGLQMDISFQRTYGGWLYRHKGTADHWTPLEQIWTAVRAAHDPGLLALAQHRERFCGLM